MIHSMGLKKNRLRTTEIMCVRVRTCVCVRVRVRVCARACVASVSVRVLRACELACWWGGVGGWVVWDMGM